MASADWTNPTGPAFRFPKTINPIPTATSRTTPLSSHLGQRTQPTRAAASRTWSRTSRNQASSQDYSQVALLLRSVRENHSSPTSTPSAEKGIPAFCPRARAYFDNDEVRLMVGCFALLLGYYEDGRGELTGRALNELARYVDECLVALADRTRARIRSAPRCSTYATGDRRA